MRISDWSSDVCSSDLRPTSVLLYLHATLLRRPILVETVRFRALLITPIRGPSFFGPVRKRGRNEPKQPEAGGVRAWRADAAHRPRFDPHPSHRRPFRRRGAVEPGRPPRGGPARGRPRPHGGAAVPRRV